MNPLVHEYTRRAKANPSAELPADPLGGDLAVHRVPGERVYSVLPFTFKGYAFLLEHEDAGYAAGDALMVPMRNIFSFMNELFDEELRVV